MHGNAVIFHMAAFLAQCGTKTWVSLTESASAPFLDSRVRGSDTAWHPPFSHVHHTSGGGLLSARQGRRQEPWETEPRPRNRQYSLGIRPQLTRLKARLGRKWSQLEFVCPTGFVLGV